MTFFFFLISSLIVNRYKLMLSHFWGGGVKLKIVIPSMWYIEVYPIFKPMKTLITMKE